MKINVEQSNLVFIYGLLFACPTNNEAENCPFRSIRKLPVETRLSLLESMPQLDHEILLMHHRKCLQANDIGMQTNSNPIAKSSKLLISA